MSKTKRGAQSCIFSNWLLRPLDCFCSQYSANTSLHHFDHRNQIQGKIKGRSARVGEPALQLIRRTEILHPYAELGISQEDLTLENISNISGSPVRENPSDLWQGLFLWLYFYSPSLHYCITLHYIALWNLLVWENFRNQNHAKSTIHLFSIANNL